jgi:DNA polymerase-1
MKTPKPVELDFETHPIRPRPHYPPKAVGFSLRLPTDRKAKYWAWGHPTGNNCSRADAMRVLAAAMEEAKRVGLMNQNVAFELDVAEAELGYELNIERMLVHETMYLLTLDEPHAPTLALKPSAERLLGLPADERDAVRDWLWDNGIIPRSKLDIGEHIWQAPGDLVGKYAVGDTDRAGKIFRLLFPRIVENGMLEAYQREQRLQPMLRKNEAEGMRVDQKGLETSLVAAEGGVAMAEAWIRKYLKAPDLEIDKKGATGLMAALEAADAVSEWSYTEKGNKSLSKKNMKSSQFRDIRLWHALQYRNKALTCVRTFMRPWVEQAQATGGRIHTHWRQVRGSAGGDDGGARSNRLQSSPNFQNIPKEFSEEAAEEGQYEHPAFIKGLVALPKMRQFILPDARGHIIGRRDYSQQEIRLLGHFEDGAILQQYLDDPYTDFHVFVKRELDALMGIEIPRKDVKTINFGLVYGMGLKSLAERMVRSYEEARTIKQAQLRILTGVKPLDDAIKARGKAGEAIRTWGGRLYYVEEPRKNAFGGMQTFEYKLLNYLIQGSAADCTKEALCRWFEAGTGDARFMLTVHDEIDASIPKAAAKHEMLRLRECMMSVEVDIPMLSDGEIGPNWGTMTELKEPRPDFSRWGIV